MKFTEQLKKLHEKATAGPWERPIYNEAWDCGATLVVGKRKIASFNWTEVASDVANANLSQTLRNALPAIVEALEAAEALNLVDEIAEYSVEDMPERGRLFDAIDSLETLVKG